MGGEYEMQKNNLNYRSKREKSVKKENVDIKRKGDYFLVQFKFIEWDKENKVMFVQKFR